MMTTQLSNYGPWTTSLDNGSRLELSAFWSRRMNALAGLATASPATRWSIVLPFVVAAALAATPLLEFYSSKARAQEAKPTEGTPWVYHSSRAKSLTDAERDEVNANWKRAHELQQELARSHGYRLATGELMKFIPASQGGDVRRELLKLVAGDREALLAFVQKGDEMVFLAAHYGKHDLADVLEDYFGIKLHRIVCDPAILDLTIDGDLLLAAVPVQWDYGAAEKFQVNVAIVEALEQTLNETLSVPLKFDVKVVDRPSLVAQGEYQFAVMAGAAHRLEGNYMEYPEGPFRFPARRDEAAESAGSFSEMLEDIGELLLLPIVDEIELRPTKGSYHLLFPNDPVVEGQTPLDDATSDAVIAALAEQSGLTLSKETRPVEMLYIEPAGEQADAAK